MTEHRHWPLGAWPDPERSDEIAALCGSISINIADALEMIEDGRSPVAARLLFTLGNVAESWSRIRSVAPHKGVETEWHRFQCELDRADAWVVNAIKGAETYVDHDLVCDPLTEMASDWHAIRAADWGL